MSRPNWGILFLGGIFGFVVADSTGHHRVLGQEVESADQQTLTAPMIPELVKKHQDLTYDGLLEALPAQPHFRRTLDFDPTKARYFDLVRKELELTEEEVEVFRRRGMVSLDNGRRYTFPKAYYEIYACDLPVLITSDSILHALHKSYDEILKELETTWFTWTLDEILAETHIALAIAAKENGDPRLEDNYRDVDLYLTVARNLLLGGGAPANQHPAAQHSNRLDGQLAVHSQFGQDDEVEARLKDIQSLKLQHPDRNAPTELYGGKRFLDYSQFRPRGHYTKSSDLQNYFRCMMWLARADTGWNVLPTDLSPAVDSDDRRELRDAVLMVQLLRETGNLERLQAVDRVINYMVGSSDSLNVDRLEELMDKVAVLSINDLIEPSRISHLQDAIIRSGIGRQLIRSQIMVSDPNDLYKVKAPVTFQLFGQRFAIDSYVLSRVVFDAVIFKNAKERRMMPKGLDVMAALGNDASVPLLEEELRAWHYGANLLAGREFVEQQDRMFWRTNLYCLWLDCLRELDSDVVNRPNVPQVMQTHTWQMKQLQTQLASWSQLRHDTILYAKQSYTMVPGCEYPAGYIEPYPEFYARVKAFALRAHKLISATRYESVAAQRNASLRKIHDQHLQFFTVMAGHVGQLETLARKELAGEAFSETERQFVGRTINSRGSVRYGSGSRTTYDGWYTKLFYRPKGHSEADAEWEATIADVHTDPESEQVLQVGVGDLNLCVIAIDNQEDTTAFVGPVFSYYEFRQEAINRLTDENWDRLIQHGNHPPRPTWVDSFVAPKKSRPRTGTFVTAQRKGDYTTLSLKIRSPMSTENARQTLELTDNGLKALAHIPELRTLDLARSRISDKGLVHLEKLDNLRELNLASTRVDGSGLGSLDGAVWLRVLSLRNTQVSDDSLRHVRGLQRLETLDLSGTNVTNRCIDQLRGMSNLRKLSLQRTAIDDDGIRQLRELLPRCLIVH